MARAEIPGRLTWRLATVEEIVTETQDVRSIEFEVPGWPGHLAGQHVDVRLTAPDGYQTERSYSIASPPEDGSRVRLTVERLPDGEVSTYLVDELRVADQIELRGPIGGYFVWEARRGGPLLLVAGGSGVVPLMAMLRHREAVASEVSARLLLSSRSLPDVIYRDELERLAQASPSLDVVHTLTRSRPDGWSSYARRIDTEMLREVAWAPDGHPLVYVCGPTPLVESVADKLVELGHDPASLRTERFGPTGPTGG